MPHSLLNKLSRPHAAANGRCQPSSHPTAPRIATNLASATFDHHPLAPPPLYHRLAYIHLPNAIFLPPPWPPSGSPTHTPPHQSHNSPSGLQELVVELLPSPQRCLNLIHHLLPQLAAEVYQAFVAEVCRSRLTKSSLAYATSCCGYHGIHHCWQSRPCKLVLQDLTLRMDDRLYRVDLC